MTQEQINTSKYKNVTIIVTISMVTSKYLILKVILPFVTKCIIEGEHFLYYSSLPLLKKTRKYDYI